ncbi:MAG: glycosyltransferase family 4 protein [Candidatus Yanofskybacteria bacterium]|nr:glycosyltransferase family 4 protein [Candidatus Yanofskybacteria bacterium]
MNVLMITGDRSLAEGKRGAFYNTLEELRRHVERIDVICPGVSVRRYDMSVFGNVFVHPSPLPLVLQWFWIFFKGRALIRQSQAAGQQTVMTVHEYSPTFFGVGARWLRRATGVSYMLEVMHITGLPQAGNLWELVNRWLFLRVIAWEAKPATAVRVINQHETPDALVAAGVSRERLRYIPAFYIDQTAFKPRDDTKQYDIAFVGRLARNKGLSLFLDVLERTGLVGVIVGDGPLARWARRSARKRGLKVHTTGFVADSAAVADVLNRSRLLVMTSQSEGGPRVVLEAMACGVPVVATPVGIVPDVLPPEAIEGWDAEALADKIRNILKDPVLYARLREGGLATVQQFERSRGIERYADAIREVASGDTR